MLFRNLAIAKKLAIGFGAVIALVAASSLLTFVRLRQVSDIERLSATAIQALTVPRQS